jgi:hypothetical protein
MDEERTTAHFWGRVVDFDRVARFQGHLSYQQAGWAQSLPIKPWFRRFYYDGVIAGRFEFGFLVDEADETTILGAHGYKYDIASLIAFLLKVPVMVRGFDLSEETLSLENFG